MINLGHGLLQKEIMKQLLHLNICDGQVGLYESGTINVSSKSPERVLRLVCLFQSNISFFLKLWLKRMSSLPSV